MALAHVTLALETVKRLLDNTREPVFAGDVRHEYSDKYLLAEFLTLSAIGTSLLHAPLLAIVSADLVHSWCGKLLEGLGCHACPAPDNARVGQIQQERQPLLRWLESVDLSEEGASSFPSLALAFMGLLLKLPFLVNERLLGKNRI